MHLILTGATGLVGASVLSAMLAQPSITRITILSRRPVPMADGHQKARVIIHKDYKAYGSALLQELNDAHGCVWAQGVSQNDVGKEEYITITHDFPIAAARAFATLHPARPFVFVYVSGEGATQSPSMFTSLFGRVKGEAETALFNFSKQHDLFKVYNVRPGGVDWKNHPEIEKFIPQQPLWKKMMVPGLNVVYKGIMTPTRPMGEVMVRLAMSGGEKLEGRGIGMEGTLVTNEALRRMGGV